MRFDGPNQSKLEDHGQITPFNNPASPRSMDKPGDNIGRESAATLGKPISVEPSLMDSSSHNRQAPPNFAERQRRSSLSKNIGETDQLYNLDLTNDLKLGAKVMEKDIGTAKPIIRRKNNKAKSRTEATIQPKLVSKNHKNRPPDLY